MSPGSVFLKNWDDFLLLLLQAVRFWLGLFSFSVFRNELMRGRCTINTARKVSDDFSNT